MGTMASLRHLATRIPDPGGGDADLSARRLLSTSGTVISADISGPIWGIAQTDAHGFYHVPVDYLVLIQRFNPGFIVLSYAIAFVGSLCTLELLCRRTTNTGWRNRVLLTAAGFTFGAVSTFAMHFIFNNSLSLHHPLHPHTGPSLHLAYGAGYTILSLFASCFAMTMAFFIMGTRIQDWWFLPWIKRDRHHDRSSTMRGASEKGEKTRDWKILSSYRLEKFLSQAGHIAGWSMIHPTGSNASATPKWRKGSADSKDRRSWGRTPEGESTEQIFNLVNTSSTGKGNHNKFEENSSGMSLELVESRQSEHVPAVEHRRSMDHGFFTPGYEFPSPSSHDLPGDVTATPNTHVSHASPTRLLSSTPQYSSFQPDLATPLAAQRRGSLPTPPAHRSTFRPPHLALTRISSLPEIDTDPTPSSSTRSSKQIRPEVPARVSSSTIGRRTSSLYRPGDMELQGGDVRDRRRASAQRRQYSQLETFFGLDILNTNELIKLCITGSVAGFGVAGMREYSQDEEDFLG